MNKYLCIIILISQYVSLISSAENELRYFLYNKIMVDVCDDYNDTKKIIHKEYEKFKLEYPISPIEDFNEKIVPLIKNFWKNNQKKHPVGFLLSMEKALVQDIELNRQWGKQKENMLIVIASFKKVFENYANDGVYEYQQDYYIGDRCWGKEYYFENEKTKIKRLCGEKLVQIAACIGCCCFVLPLLIETIIAIREKLTQGRVNNFEQKKRMDKMLIFGGCIGVLSLAIGFGLQMCIKKIFSRAIIFLKYLK